MIVVTGGTFLKTYDPREGKLVLCKDYSQGAKAIDELCSSHAIEREIYWWGSYDSLDLTSHDRESLVDWCGESPSDAMVIIHGTDTMHLTQKAFIERNLQKKIILTGAFVPACCNGSDAAFNLGFALGCLTSVDPGVYVAMNGRLFKDQVRKNVERSVFELDI